MGPRFTRAELESFRGAVVPDLAGPGMRLLFVGINPGLLTAARQIHFGNPANRFRPALVATGLLAPPPDGQPGPAPAPFAAPVAAPVAAVPAEVGQAAEAPGEAPGLDTQTPGAAVPEPAGAPAEGTATT